MIKKTIGRINKFFAEISGWLLCVIMVLLIIDFASRGLSAPIHGVGEIAVFVMVAVVYLGLAHTEETRGHVRVNALISRLPPRAQLFSEIAIHLVALCAIAIVVWAVALNVIKAFYSQEAVAGTVPLLVWPVKLMVFVGCFFYLLQIILNLIEEVQKFTNKTVD